MTLEMSTVSVTRASPVRRRLVLVWRQPGTRRFIRVARLDALGAGGYRFEYEPVAAHLADFSALDEYPDFDRAVESVSLPAFFRNRVMSSERLSYPQYVAWFGLDQAGAVEADVPIELLVRSGAGRATDTFHVVEEPGEVDGLFVARFFVSGLSHVDGVEARLGGLEAGARLVLRDDPQNTANPLAVALDAQPDEQIGWVPDWLCDEVRRRRSAGSFLAAVVERVNADAPPHVRVLCRIEGSPLPA